jgi:preprotein translocase subunit SecE
MAAGKEMAETSGGNFVARAARFVREVRQEVSKVTWPSRKETGITTAMVFVMVLIMSIFFLVVDLLLGGAVETILSLGR